MRPNLGCPRSISGAPSSRGIGKSCSLVILMQNGAAGSVRGMVTLRNDNCRLGAVLELIKGRLIQFSASILGSF